MNRFTWKSTALVFSISLSVACAQGQDADRKHDVTVDDCFSLAQITESAISPDGKFVAYAESRWKKGTGDHKADLWVVPTKSGKPTRLTSDQAGERSIRWSPDGVFLYFLANRIHKGSKEPAKTQVWRLRSGADEPVAVTHVPAGIDGYDLAAGRQVDLLHRIPASHRWRLGPASQEVRPSRIRPRPRRPHDDPQAVAGDVARGGRRRAQASRHGVLRIAGRQTTGDRLLAGEQGHQSRRAHRGRRRRPRHGCDDEASRRSLAREGPVPVRQAELARLVPGRQSACVRHRFRRLSERNPRGEVDRREAGCREVAALSGNHAACGSRRNDADAMARPHRALLRRRRSCPHAHLQRQECRQAQRRSRSSA